MQDAQDNPHFKNRYGSLAPHVAVDLLLEVLYYELVMPCC